MESIITLGIGSGPGSLLWFMTTGLGVAGPPPTGLVPLIARGRDFSLTAPMRDFSLTVPGRG